MKSWHTHYANKYPGGRVHRSESSVDVFCKDGNHRVRLEKNGAGQWTDKSEENGCVDRHDLSPIPKEARYLKLFGDGMIRHAEEHDDRKATALDLASKFGGKVPSIEELKASDAAQAKAAQAAKPQS